MKPTLASGALSVLSPSAEPMSDDEKIRLFAQQLGIAPGQQENRAQRRAREKRLKKLGKIVNKVKARKSTR